MICGRFPQADFVIVGEGGDFRAGALKQEKQRHNDGGSLDVGCPR
jgi:hypothetical protein